MRRAAARNILKAWVLVAILAGVFGGIGWLLADERGAALFAFCVPTRRRRGIRRRRSRAARDARCAAVRARRGSPAPLDGRPSRREARDRSAEAPADRRRLPAGVRGRARPAQRHARGQHRAPDGAHPRELEAVLAHELAHVRTRDVLTQTQVVLLATTLLEMSRVGGFLSRFLRRGSRAGRRGVHAPPAVAAARAHGRRGRRRVVDPHDLADALLRLDRAAELVAFHASPATEPLYTVSPFDHTDRIARMFVTHPPLAGARRAPAGADPPDRPRGRGRSRFTPGRGGRRSGARWTTKGAHAASLPEINRRHPTLPGACAPSTIGASGLNFSVRNGKRYFPAAMTAEVSKVALTGRRPGPRYLQNSIATQRVQNQDLGQLVRVS